MFGPAVSFAVALALAQQAGEQAAAPPRPVLATARTLADPAALAALEQPGEVLFRDDFETDASLKRYFEIRGLAEGRARLDSEQAHSGERSFRFAAPARDGNASGSGASGWLGAEGHERVHIRTYLRFADDYDQGHLNHTGAGLAAIAGSGKWDEMGKAGVKPRGDDRFTTAFETWRDWGRSPSPGFLHAYTYWMDMGPAPDGNFWGTMFAPEPEQRLVPPRGKWVCHELMLKANTAGAPDGELAAWVDGKLYLHVTGARWRTTDAVRIKRFDFGVYVHQARRDNLVWFDDVVVSTGYVGPAKDGRGARRAPKTVRRSSRWNAPWPGRSTPGRRVALEVKRGSQFAEERARA